MKNKSSRSNLASPKTNFQEMEKGYRKWYGSFNETIPESMFTDWNVGVPRIWLQPLCDTFPYISC